MTHNPLASPAFKGKSQNGLYGDATEELDWSMGVLLETLKEEGLDQNTLVITLPIMVRMNTSVVRTVR